MYPKAQRGRIPRERNKYHGYTVRGTPGVILHLVYLNYQHLSMLGTVGTRRDGVSELLVITTIPRKTNMSPENPWLGGVFPIEIVPFRGHVIFRGCIPHEDLRSKIIGVTFGGQGFTENLLCENQKLRM